MKLAQRAFNDADQKRFASVSGDHNPMHMDPLKARRTPAGAPVVHGIHLLLWALDCFKDAYPDLPPLRGLRTQFNKFVFLNECVDLMVTRQEPAGARLVISVGGDPRSKVALEFGNSVADLPDWSAFELEAVPFTPAPLNPNFNRICGCSGRISLPMAQGERATLFPALTQWLGDGRVAALAASTYLVGMVCPGLHSIYNELAIHVCSDPGSRESLAFRVTETDARFRSVEQQIAGGGITGALTSFARHPPAQQATMESLAGTLRTNEFAGSVALIVGGSRGIGELTAKLIATGGGRVLITWQAGRDDAERVAAEIRSTGGSCETLPYDVREPAAEQLAVLPVIPTHMYYFATPLIFRPQPEIFSATRLKEFLDVYVEGFWQLVQTLRHRQPGLSFFYPSSVFVTERPRGMTEYTMAKAAAEVMCADMNVSLPTAHVTVIRLPRLATDQTASIAPEECADPLATMLPIIREVQSWPRMGIGHGENPLS